MDEKDFAVQIATLKTLVSSVRKDHKKDWVFAHSEFAKWFCVYAGVEQPAVAFYTDEYDKQGDRIIAPAWLTACKEACVKTANNPAKYDRTIVRVSAWCGRGFVAYLMGLDNPAEPSLDVVVKELETTKAENDALKREIEALKNAGKSPVKAKA